MHDAKGLLVAMKTCEAESRCVRVSSVFSARSEHTSVGPDSCLTHSAGVSVIDSSGAASRPQFHGGIVPPRRVWHGSVCLSEPQRRAAFRQSLSPSCGANWKRRGGGFLRTKLFFLFQRRRDGTCAHGRGRLTAAWEQRGHRCAALIHSEPQEDPIIFNGLSIHW